jgi:hypothetical protein
VLYTCSACRVLEAVSLSSTTPAFCSVVAVVSCQLSELLSQVLFQVQSCFQVSSCTDLYMLLLVIVDRYS